MVMFQVEMTNRCNLRCSYCPRTGNPPTESKDITPSEFHHILNQLLTIKHGNTKWFALCGHGEPLMSPYFMEILRDPLLQKFSNVQIITNGDLLTKKTIKSIIDVGVIRTIQVSLQTTRKEIFDKLQVGADFENVVANTRNLIKYAKGTKTRIKIQHLSTRLNGDETKDDFERLLDIKFGGGVSFHRHPVGPVGMMAPKFSYDFLVPRISNKKPLWGHTQVCYNVFAKKHIVINAYGDLLGCCWLQSRKQNYGNIYEKPLLDLIKGPLLKALRRELVERDFHRLPLCKKCLMGHLQDTS